jgi:hypothetical protein
MPPLFIVSSDGVPLVLDKPKPPTPLVEVEEEPLWQVAAEQHAKDSTPKNRKQNEQT